MLYERKLKDWNCTRKGKSKNSKLLAQRDWLNEWSRSVSTRFRFIAGPGKGLDHYLLTCLPDGLLLLPYLTLLPHSLLALLYFTLLVPLTGTKLI